MSRVRLSLIAAGPVAALSALALVLPAGCGPTATTQKTNTSSGKQATDPWPRAASELRADADPATCRRVLSQLGSDLVSNPAADQPTGLTPAAEKALTAAYPLTDDDLAEVRPAGFTPLDGAYLADCLYLRDAAKAIEPPNPTPARQAEAAFAWVCRQVELRPWLLQQQQSLINPPLPPTAVLRRGSGSGLERAYVFLALLQQYGVDGCLIGGPDAGGQRSIMPFPANYPGWPKGPFWAVGARAGADVLVFDPWRGEPLPGLGGKGVATLSQITADPNILKPWFDDKAHPWEVTAADVKAATPYLAVPLNAAAPRLALLEKKLAGDLGVRLVVDPVAAKERFVNEAKLPGTRPWNPAGDPFDYTRTLATFLPVDEGGKDAGPERQRLIDRYKFEQFPPTLFAVPPGLTSREVAGQLLNAFATRFESAFLTPPSPRERIQRGLYFEAIPVLVKKRDEFAAGRERTRTDRNREDAVRKWVQEANDVYAALGRARLDERQNPGSVAEAQEAIARFWKGSTGNGVNATGVIVDAAVADTGLAEATYLLALCKHEQAEAAQARADASSASDDSAAVARAKDQVRDAWADARDWWSRYAPLAASQDAGFPGRSAHAGQLAERANRLAAQAAR